MLFGCINFKIISLKIGKLSEFIILLFRFFHSIRVDGKFEILKKVYVTLNWEMLSIFPFLHVLLTVEILWTDWADTCSLRASGRFIPPIFLGIFRRIGTFRRGNWCDTYVGQLPPVWGIRGNALSQFPQIWRVFTPFLIWPNFTQKKRPNKRTLKF